MVTRWSHKPQKAVQICPHAIRCISALNENIKIRKNERHAICHVKRVQYSGDILRIKMNKYNKNKNKGDDIYAKKAQSC